MLLTNTGRTLLIQNLLLEYIPRAIVHIIIRINTNAFIIFTHSEGFSREVATRESQ